MNHYIEPFFEVRFILILCVIGMVVFDTVLLVSSSIIRDSDVFDTIIAAIFISKFFCIAIGFILGSLKFNKNIDKPNGVV